MLNISTRIGTVGAGIGARAASRCRSGSAIHLQNVLLLVCAKVHATYRNPHTVLSFVANQKTKILHLPSLELDFVYRSSLYSTPQHFSSSWQYSGGSYKNDSATWYSTHACSILLRFNCINGVFI
jgi:hypothetical protein